LKLLVTRSKVEVEDVRAFVIVKSQCIFATIPFKIGCVARNCMPGSLFIHLVVLRSGLQPVLGTEQSHSHLRDIVGVWDLSDMVMALVIFNPPLDGFHLNSGRSS
jgi:hypothetical protein